MEKIRIQLLLIHIKSTSTYTMKQSSFKYSPREFLENMQTSQRTIVWWLLFCIYSVNNIVVFLHVFQTFCLGKIKKKPVSSSGYFHLEYFLFNLSMQRKVSSIFNVMMTIMTITWRAKVNLGFSFINDPMVFFGVASQWRTDVVKKMPVFRF